MALASPFEWLSPKAQIRAFIVLIVLTLVVNYFWNALDASLRNSAAPKGVQSFEVAGTVDRDQAILASWGPAGQIRAAANSGLDCLFLFLYAGVISLGCALVAGAFPGWRLFAGLGLLLAWAQILAGLLDAIEEYALMRILMGAKESWLPALARSVAIPKDILYATGMVYAILGAVLFVGRKIFAHKPLSAKASD